MYKCLNQMCPEYMSQFMQYQTNDVYKMRSESQKKLVIPKVKYELFRKSFTYSGAILWNQLPNDIRSAGPLAHFKKSCFEHQMSAAFPSSTAWSYLKV